MVYERRVLVAALSVAVFVVGACGRKAPVEAEWLARGSEIVQPFKTDLKQALTDALQEGAVEDAIEVCQLRAPMIAARVGDESIRVGRTSHRLRNPSNRPEPWMQPLLDKFLSDPQTAGPQAVALDGDRVGYVEPIYVQGMCLACHGENLAPAVANAIDHHYPEDNARGFAAGDFRGLFWAEFPVASR